MVLCKKVQDITKELILSKVDEYDIMRFYIGSNLKLNVAMNSVLRRDNTPSFSVRMSKNGHLYYTDYATEEYGDAINLVEKMYGLSYNKALQKIAADMGIVSANEEYKKIMSEYIKPVMDVKRHALLQCTTKRFNNRELNDYWGRYKVIGQEKLRKHDVYSLKEVFLNRKKVPIGKNEMVFGYWYTNGWKVMFPERAHEHKWLSNIPLDTPGGLQNLNKDHNTLIVKSKKCFMVMEDVYEYLCYMQNEGLGSVTEKTASYINENSKKVFYGGDADSAGKKASYKITGKFSWNHVNTPDKLLPRKDWSDWAEYAETLEPIKQHLKLKGVIE